MSESDPKLIVQQIVDQTGQALLDDDFSAFHAWQKMPQPIETIEGRQFVETSEDMKKIFHSVTSDYRRRGVTRIDRRVTSASYVASGQIEATYHTDLYRGEELLKNSYQSFISLKRLEEGWRIVYSMYAAPTNPNFNEALLRQPDSSDKVA